MHNKGNLILALTCPPMMKVMMTIGKDRELLQARPSLTKKSTTISVNIKAHLLGVLGNDAMSKALDQLSKSSFTRYIEGATLPRRFQQPTFTIYNRKTDPVEHVSQFNQRMAIHSKNEALMCKVFLSSLGLVAMSWFNDLKTNSVDLYR